MNTKKLLLPLLLASTTLVVSGCNLFKKKNQPGGAQTIQIKAYKGGYGTDFMHELADRYHEAHPEISFEFLDESSLLDGEKAAAEIGVPKKNQVDLYFVTGVDINYLVKRSSTVLGKRDETLLEPLDSVFESKGVGLDGKEEASTIKSRFFNGFEELCRYDGEFPKWRGTMFTLPWAEATTGIFMNKAVLDRYGVSVPLTSDEFAAAVQTIYTAGKPNNNYPFSWGGGNAAGYWQYLYETWFAQYSGQKKFYNFQMCDPGNGNIVQEGYKVYEDVGILKALEAMFQILDLNYSPNGSRTQQHTEAQTDFITGKTAFMIDGDWMLNEMKEYYYDQGKEIMMLRAPILSSIGSEIGISDAQLHTLVESIDSHLDNVAIKALIPSLSDANIERVRDARSVHDTIGIGHNVLIPSYADAKDAAKEFLKFVYSNDGCRIFRNFAFANLPLTYETKDGDSNTPFQQSLDKVRDYENPQIVTSVASYNGVRTTPSPQILTFNYSAWQTPYTFVYIMLDKAGDKQFTPQSIFDGEKDFIRSEWPTRMIYIDYL